MNQTILDIQERLQQQQLDAMVIMTPSNRFYASKFRSTAGMALITPSRAWFLVDFRYIEAARATIEGMDVVQVNGKYYDYLSSQAKEHHFARVGFEERSITYWEYTQLQACMKGAELVPAEEMLLQLRQVKAPEELKAIQNAQRISETAFAEILNFIKPGRTEREIQIELDYQMQKAGGEGLAFDSIVVSGANSSKPHGVPTDKQVQDGDFLTMDFGCKFGGYCADMTRTVAIGHATDEMRQVYDTVLRAQKEAMAHIHANMAGSLADSFARDIIREAGYGEHFGHALGHSVGIDIHELPSFAPRYDAMIPAGAVMSVEPGIYLPGEFGVRIEDLVLVQENGVASLNTSEKELIIL